MVVDHVWTDPAALAAAVRNLALEACDNGARRIRIDATEAKAGVELTVAHDGAPLTDAVAALVFRRSHDGERSAVEAGAAPVRLLAAQALLETLGRSLEHVARDGGPAYVAQLPGAAPAPRRAPALTERAAPATA